MRKYETIYIIGWLSTLHVIHAVSQNTILQTTIPVGITQFNEFMSMIF